MTLVAAGPTAVTAATAQFPRENQSVGRWPGALLELRQKVRELVETRKKS